MSRLFAVFFFVLLSFFGEAFAQRTPRQERIQNRRTQTTKAERVHTRKVLRRTNIAIHQAKAQLQTGQNKTGDLARAVSHQRFAMSLARRGMEKRAISHSRRARRLAFASIKANSGEISKELNFQADEGNDGGFTDSQLDAALNQEFGSQVVLEDDRILEDPLSDLEQ